MSLFLPPSFSLSLSSPFPLCLRVCLRLPLPLSHVSIFLSCGTWNVCIDRLLLCWRRDACATSAPLADRRDLTLVQEVMTDADSVLSIAGSRAAYTNTHNYTQRYATAATDFFRSVQSRATAVIKADTSRNWLNA